jgi:eukaryotic-like serine/threonine-protein kinase
MAHRFLCLQGHLWAYEEDSARAARALFCPTCGLRLHPENHVPQLALPRLLTVPTAVTPNFPTGSIHLSGLALGPAGPAVQPSDIEEIPGYELLGILGRGGMGIVYRARQLSLKRQVALKMILTGRHARPDERARFQREAEAVARLQHPHIVQIHEIGQQNGLPYFSLEFVNAGSLAQFMGGIPQPPLPCAEFLLVLARAMHYAHKRGVVHRDLKPANILLHLDESQLLKNGHDPDTALLRALASYVPKISDFGLAHHIGGEERPTRVGTLLGTPSYMAPEQARGVGDIGPAADVYALGAVLYEMLTGRPPFKATTPEETALQVLTQEPVPPAQLQPKVPLDLETICLTCLHKQPSGRYASAEALAEDLRRFLAHEPILAQPRRLPDRMRKWARRHPLSMGALWGLSLLALLLAWDWYRLTGALRREVEQAHQARYQTEGELQQALQTIEHMNTLALRAVSSAPGETPKLRRELLESARRFYAQRLPAIGTEAVQPFLVAEVHLRLAETCAELNDRAAALESYKEAARLLARLCAAEPARAEHRQLLEKARRRAVLSPSPSEAGSSPGI